MKYPKIYMDRGNHASQVVVNNETDEAALPSNWVPLDGTPSGATGAVPGIDPADDSTAIKGATGKANALAEQQADLDQRRKQFDQDVDQLGREFKSKKDELTKLRDQLDADGEKLANERKQLDQDRAYFEQEKEAAKLAPAPAADPKDGEQAAPAKRTRHAKD